MTSDTHRAGAFNNPFVDIEGLKRTGKIFGENVGATIIDIGDRIALVEFHSTGNTLTSEVIEIVSTAIQQGSEKFDAIVIGNRGRHFSGGHNLEFLLESSRLGNWNETDRMFRRFQETNMNIKYGPLPVVSAPFNNTLGGGCEIVLHSSGIVAAMDLHMGLVEAGVGLVPAGGGTKELILREMNRFRNDGNLNRMPALQNVFDLIFSARISKNADEARRLFLLQADIIAPPKLPPIEIAKQVALDMVKAGYHRAVPDKAIAVPGVSGINIFQNSINYMLDSRKITEHDAVIGQHIATILCGGNVLPGTATEQQFLDLEREALLSLLGTQKTQARIEFLLKNNKPLRN